MENKTLFIFLILFLVLGFALGFLIGALVLFPSQFQPTRKPLPETFEDLYVKCVNRSIGFDLENMNECGNILNDAEDRTENYFRCGDKLVTEVGVTQIDSGECEFVIK